MHKKRSELPSNWPLARKGTAYFVVGTHSNSDGIPLVIALRDILGVVKTNRELRVMLLNKEIMVNQKVRKSEKYPVRAFDSITIAKTKQNFKLVIAGKKMKFEQVKDDETKNKTIKIIGKVVLPNKAVQMNLEDGTNLLVKEKFSVGDSIVLNLKENKLEKILPLKENAKVFIVSGKHAGKEGKIKEIVNQNNKKEYLIKFAEDEATLPLKTLLVVD